MLSTTFESCPFVVYIIKHAFLSQREENKYRRHHCHHHWRELTALRISLHTSFLARLSISAVLQRLQMCNTRWLWSKTIWINSNNPRSSKVRFTHSIEKMQHENSECIWLLFFLPNNINFPLRHVEKRFQQTWARWLFDDWFRHRSTTDLNSHAAYRMVSRSPL